MSSSLAPRYDLHRNPPYQINYRSKRAGKHITATKRRITFQFGFSSAKAIASGETEANCRGEEHEVVLIWSHVSGKRELFMDGKPIHASKAARGNTKFQHTWGIGTHVLKIIANGTPPMGDNPYARQFDLQLDGISFFRFFKIYQLGRAQVKDLPSQAHDSYSPECSNEYTYQGASYAAEENDCDEEDAYSREEVANVRPSVKVENKKEDLIDTPERLLTKTVDLFDSSPSAMTSPTMSFTSSVSSFDEFSPVVSTNSSKPTFDSSMILSAYNTASNALQLPYQVESRGDTNSRALVPVSEDQVDVITKSMKNIVNLDDLNSKPLVTQPFNSNNSNTFSGASNWGLVGRQPTLAEMKAHMTAPTSAQQQQQVLRNQPYGQTMNNQPYGQVPIQNQPYGLAPIQNQPYGQVPMQNQPIPMQNQPYGQVPMQSQPYGYSGNSQPQYTYAAY